jgi:hypothetical protein
MSAPLTGAAIALLMGQADLLIWGGAKTEAEASTWMQRWTVENPFQGDGTTGPTLPGSWFELASPYPQILKSDGVEGLKPGFHLVVLGACEPGKAAAALALVKAAYAGAYLRTVTSAVPLGCPKTGATVEATYELKHPSGSVLQLTALRFSSASRDGSAPQQEDGSAHGLIAYLRKGTGPLLDRRCAWEGFPFFAAARMAVPDATGAYKMAGGCVTRACCEYQVRRLRLVNRGARIGDEETPSEERIRVPCD